MQSLQVYLKRSPHTLGYHSCGDESCPLATGKASTKPLLGVMYETSPFLADLKRHFTGTMNGEKTVNTQLLVHSKSFLEQG